jgi:hypothetical protein
MLSGNEIGVEVADAAQIPNSIPFVCNIPGASFCLQADVAAVQYHDSVASTFGVVARSTAYTTWLPPQPVPPSIIGSLTLGPQNTGSLSGLPVRKVGRTSGETGGRVTATCVTTSTSTYPTEYVLCSDVANMYVRPGDSGSPVYKANIGVFNKAGIVWAASSNGATSYFSPNSQINGALLGQFYW